MKVDRSKLMTVPEFASEAGLSDRTIRRYIADGRIEAYRLGPQALRVHRDQLDRLYTRDERWEESS